jgi:hypothetical protein
MFLCLVCGVQKPNLYKPHVCPCCKSYLKYIEAPVKDLVRTMYSAGLRLTYAVADVSTMDECPAVYTTHICIGLACDYPRETFETIPEGFRYETPEQYTLKSLIAMERTIVVDIISPIRTYCVLRYDTEYLTQAEARDALRTKVKELKEWAERYIDSDWRVVAKFVGWLD